MRNILTVLFLSLLLIGNASAQTILQALKVAYNNNVELNAERENLTVSEQELKITRSEYLPSATITSSKSQEDTNKLTNQSGGNATINDIDPSLVDDHILVDMYFSQSNQVSLPMKHIGFPGNRVLVPCFLPTHLY